MREMLPRRETRARRPFGNLGNAVEMGQTRKGRGFAKNTNSMNAADENNHVQCPKGWKSIENMRVIDMQEELQSCGFEMKKLRRLRKAELANLVQETRSLN